MDDIDLNKIGGTSVSKLKNRSNPSPQDSAQNTEIEIDYNALLSELNQDNKIDTKNNERDVQIRSLQNTNDSKKSKKNINMNSFVRNLETNIENLNKKPISSIQLNGEEIPKIEKPVEVKEKSYIDMMVEFKYLDIIISVLLFTLLNNKVVIELIYRLPYINNIDSHLPNLIIRSIIFGLLLYIIKKYYL